MIKRENTLDIPVFDGDDGIKYIRYKDLEKMLKRIKEVHDSIENALKIEIMNKDKEIERLNNIIYEALHLVFHHDIMDYRVFEENLEEILRGQDVNE